LLDEISEKEHFVYVAFPIPLPQMITVFSVKKARQGFKCA